LGEGYIASVRSHVADDADVDTADVTVTVSPESEVVTATILYAASAWGAAQDKRKDYRDLDNAGAAATMGLDELGQTVVSFTFQLSGVGVATPASPPAPPLGGMECLPTTRSAAYLTGVDNDWTSADFDVYYSPARPSQAATLLPNSMFDGDTSGSSFACTYHSTAGTNEHPRYAVSYNDTANHGTKVVYVGELTSAHVGYLVPFRVGVARTKDGAIEQLCAGGEAVHPTASAAETFYASTCEVSSTNPWIVIEDMELATGPFPDGNDKSLCVSELYVCNQAGPRPPPPVNAPPAPPLDLEDGSPMDESCVPSWDSRQDDLLEMIGDSNADWKIPGVMEVFVFPESRTVQGVHVKPPKLFDGKSSGGLTFSCTHNGDTESRTGFPRFSFHQTTGYGSRIIYFSENNFAPDKWLHPFQVGVAASKDGLIVEHCAGGSHLNLSAPLVSHQTFSARCTTSVSNPWIVVQDLVSRTAENKRAICLEEVAICNATPDSPPPPLA